MALRGTLVCDSENWCTYYFPVVCFIHVCDQTLAEQLYRDKGLSRSLKSEFFTTSQTCSKIYG